MNDTGAACAGEFFQAGGTLAPDAPSYVERAADRELFERVSAGELCYALTPRQMGKSSLMARTALRLRRAEVQTAAIDLSAIGGQKAEMSAEQWYYGIAFRLLKDLKLAFDLAGWWETHRLLPPVNRMLELFAEAVLARIDGRAVVFVDEIDTTIALPFSDDFFAVIRACYNARATAPDYRRLSFVLLGVASPTDLIKDVERTPFNVGRRIDLAGFGFEEARALATGLHPDAVRGEALLRRVLYWTDGHPYLTQKLCAALGGSEIATAAEPDTAVDATVAREFLAAGKTRSEEHCARSTRGSPRHPAIGGQCSRPTRASGAVRGLRTGRSRPCSRRSSSPASSRPTMRDTWWSATVSMAPSSMRAGSRSPCRPTGTDVWPSPPWW
ncbi:MAG: AAA-like domain-containing protein [Beggiatoa sp.]|nr:AAA-like domain-containing protein [Beggiatoa sp.]